MTKRHPSAATRLRRSRSRIIWSGSRCQRPSYSTATFALSIAMSRRARNRRFRRTMCCGTGSKPPMTSTTRSSDSGSDSDRGSAMSRAHLASRIPRFRRFSSERANVERRTRPDRRNASTSGTAMRSRRTHPLLRGESRSIRSSVIRGGRAMRMPCHGRDSRRVTAVRRTRIPSMGPNLYFSGTTNSTGSLGFASWTPRTVAAERPVRTASFGTMRAAPRHRSSWVTGTSART
ncbi:hypothetical protein SAMN05216266_10860 [Amycolatopsis marina]|uniref:Uncharacterized protein n=1 Tax=Amycolatopsis marina TaxID=490629 RepID=A0A1I0ZZZ1_9PSEU|nr:hypothetical protein SAMN05216266_10860 [Amycolatopsis marina]